MLCALISNIKIDSRINVCFFQWIFKTLCIFWWSLHTCRHRNDVRPQEEAQSSCWFVPNLDVHVDLWIYSALFSWWLRLYNQKNAVTVLCF